MICNSVTKRTIVKSLRSNDVTIWGGEFIERDLWEALFRVKCENNKRKTNMTLKELTHCEYHGNFVYYSGFIFKIFCYRLNIIINSILLLLLSVTTPCNSRRALRNAPGAFCYKKT
jgi:hypothetical protein